MSRFWSDVVHQLTPYARESGQAEHQRKPLSPSPRVVDAIRRELDQDGYTLRKYPDPDSRALRQTVARYHGLSLLCHKY
jgi:histidinol-phosphate aminotransferase